MVQRQEVEEEMVVVELAEAARAVAVDIVDGKCSCGGETWFQGSVWMLHLHHHHSTTSLTRVEKLLDAPTLPAVSGDEVPCFAVASTAVHQ